MEIKVKGQAKTTPTKKKGPVKKGSMDDLGL
jgi:hypothetical protein